MTYSMNYVDISYHIRTCMYNHLHVYTYMYTEQKDKKMGMYIQAWSCCHHMTYMYMYVCDVYVHIIIMYIHVASLTPLYIM